MSLRIITNADELNKDTSKFVDYNDIFSINNIKKR